MWLYVCVCAWCACINTCAHVRLLSRDLLCFRFQGQRVTSRDVFLNSACMNSFISARRRMITQWFVVLIRRESLSRLPSTMASPKIADVKVVSSRSVDDRVLHTHVHSRPQTTHRLLATAQMGRPGGGLQTQLQRAGQVAEVADRRGKDRVRLAQELLPESGHHST